MLETGPRRIASASPAAATTVPRPHDGGRDRGVRSSGPPGAAEGPALVRGGAPSTAAANGAPLPVEERPRIRLAAPPVELLAAGRPRGAIARQLASRGIVVGVLGRTRDASPALLVARE